MTKRPPQIRLYGIGLAALLMVAAAGCSDSEGPTGVTQTPALQTDVAVAPSSIAQGQGADVEITLRNQTIAEVTLGFANQQQFGYTVETQTGNVVLTYPFIFQPAGSWLVIAPRQTVNVTKPLFTNGLTPGRYIVRAGLLDNEEYSWAAAELIVRE